MHRLAHPPVHPRRSGHSARKNQWYCIPNNYEDRDGCLLCGRNIPFVKFKDGQQFHRSYPETFWVGEFFNKSIIGAGKMDAGTAVTCEASDVYLVNNHILPCDIRFLAAAPIEVGVDNDTFWKGIAVLRKNSGLIHGWFSPWRRPVDRACIGVE